MLSKFGDRRRKKKLRARNAEDKTRQGSINMKFAKLIFEKRNKEAIFSD